jgi:hypothetical protein
MKKPLLIILTLMFTYPAYAKVDLVTLPKRDAVELTIYNSADLTLARENRSLTLKEGLNQLQFSWVNTLIDPTSLDMVAKSSAGQIDINDLDFPARVKNAGVWDIQSKMAGNVPVEISYLTSGISWRAFYSGMLTPDETKMKLSGYVRVENQSGEDYENATVRLIVGQVHMVDQIASLASGAFPYGTPQGNPMGFGGGFEKDEEMYNARREVKKSMARMADMAMAAETPSMKQIIKEGISEYFIYTIEGTETIPTGWAKRLPSFEALDVPVVNLYKYEQERYGDGVIRFLSFKNDKDHKLGTTPIPGGMIKVFKENDKEKHLSYEGQSNFKYIPVDEDVELNLGAVQQVIVKPTLMAYRTDSYQFDQNKNITGWDEIYDYKVEIKNTKNIPIRVEIKRTMNEPNWKIDNKGDFGKYEKVDVDTVKYTIDVPAKTNKEFTYIQTVFQGSRIK